MLAVRLVEALWWADGWAMRRQFDAGLAEGVLRPWLVPGLSCCPEPMAGAFEILAMGEVEGIDLSALARIEIQLRTLDLPGLQAALPHLPRKLSQ